MGRHTLNHSRGHLSGLESFRDKPSQDLATRRIGNVVFWCLGVVKEVGLLNQSCDSKWSGKGYGVTWTIVTNSGGLKPPFGRCRNYFHNGPWRWLVCDTRVWHEITNLICRLTLKNLGSKHEILGGLGSSTAGHCPPWSDSWCEPSIESSRLPPSSLPVWLWSGEETWGWDWLGKGHLEGHKRGGFGSPDWCFLGLLWTEEVGEPSGW